MGLGFRVVHFGFKIIAGGSNVRKQLCAVAPLRCAVSGEIAPCGLRRCAVAPLLVYAGAVVRAHAVAPLRRCAVAPCRRAGFIKMPGRAYAPLRRCAAAPLPRAWTTMQLVAQASFRCYAAAPSATEQRSNGATERSCAAAARTLWHGATERGAAERSCAAAARSTGTEVRSRATEHGATEGSCAAAAKAHGARSTERSIGVRSEAI